MLVAVKSATPGWVTWARSKGGMLGSQAIFAYLNSAGLGSVTASVEDYSVSGWSTPWQLTLLGQPSVQRLVSGELLLEFEMQWNWAPEQRVGFMIGSGRYTASAQGISGVQRHTGYPAALAVSLANAA